ncbi:MAG: TetR family transcriptional regulator [Chloroflexota bacterium]
MTFSRRSITHEHTLAEIKAFARGQIVKNGPASLSLASIAKEMNVSTPALYRFF